jgi:Predicted acyltransferases
MGHPYKTFAGIQFLRYIAALLVVVTHATGSYNEKILGLGAGQYWFLGMSGVDVFFVISGFVMASTAEKFQGDNNSYIDFALRRIIRVVPLYWGATSFKVALAIILPSLAVHSKLDITYILSCYLFIPSLNADNEYLPILTVGWTLIYEMFFYLMISVALFFNLSVLRFVAVVFSLLSLLSLLKQDNSMAIFYFTNPIILEFCYGMLAFFIVRRYIEQLQGWGSVLIAIGVLSLLFIDMDSAQLGSRFIFWGIPAFMLVLGVALTEELFRTKVLSKISYLGDTSYSLYLLHPFIVPFVMLIIGKFNLALMPMAVMACVIISTGIAILSYEKVEKPITKYLNALIRR